MLTPADCAHALRLACESLRRGGFAAATPYAVGCLDGVCQAIAAPPRVKRFLDFLRHEQGKPFAFQRRDIIRAGCKDVLAYASILTGAAYLRSLAARVAGGNLPAEEAYNHLADGQRFCLDAVQGGSPSCAHVSRARLACRAGMLALDTVDGTQPCDSRTYPYLRRAAGAMLAAASALDHDD